jgi:mannose-1-phosphate guanylyltransferase
MAYEVRRFSSAFEPEACGSRYGSGVCFCPEPRDPATPTRGCYTEPSPVTLPVFLLAAGLGTRLRPLTSLLPKPLLPVGDRPALAHILDRVRPVAGSLVANAHHLAPDLRAYVTESAPDVLISEEPRILGTAGGLAAAAGLLGAGDVLVWNGDILADLDAAELVAAHLAHPSAVASLAVKPLAAGEGNVGLDLGGRIVRLRRETTGAGEVSGGAFLGVHVVGAALRDRLPSEGCLVGDVYLPALRKGETLRGLPVTGLEWHDIGTIADYAAACFAWLERRNGDGGSFVDGGATVASGVELRESIVGRGASVSGSGVVERCVVWPGATVTAPCSEAIVTTAGVVPFRG